MPVYDSLALPAQAAAGADATTLVATVEAADASGWGVTRMEITPPSGYTTVTGQATNNVTFSVRQVRAGAVQATIGSLTLAAGTNLVAETPVNVPVSTQVTLQQDDVLDVLMHQNGTGLAVGAGLIVTVDVN